MDTIIVICGLVFFATTTIGLLLLALAFITEWDWALRVSYACGALCALSLFWGAVLMN